MQKPMRKPSKPAQNGGNPAETLRKPCGNPKKLAENLRKPFGNSAETLQKPKETPTFSLWKLKCLNEGWRPITSKEELQDPCHSIIRPLRLKGVQLSDHNGPWSRCCRWLKTTFLRNLYTCDLPALVLVRLHLESSFLKISTCELFSLKRSTCEHSSLEISTCASAACAQPCHRVVPTYCTGIQPTTKATELPRLATTSHLPL